MRNKINEQGQLNMFQSTDLLTIDKPIRLIELFGGYGSQALSLKYLGVPFEHWKLSEWAIPSIKAHFNCHCGVRHKTGKSAAEVKEWLKGRISKDYNEPLADDKIDKMKDKDAVELYEMMVADHNLGSICAIHGKDLEITDTDKYCYIMCYSFPCQDLSSAGLLKGMSRNSGTRSGLLWEVERLLKECDELPQILLMENVPNVCGTKNIDDFNEWLNVLEDLGYHSKYEILNAKDYKIPQNRERCFCISWRADAQYHFPQPFELEICMRNCLEDRVGEKYYLKDETVQNFIDYCERKQEEGCGFKFEATTGGGTLKPSSPDRENALATTSCVKMKHMGKEIRNNDKGVSLAILTHLARGLSDNNMEDNGVIECGN